MTPGTVFTHPTLTSSSGAFFATLHCSRAPSLTAALARDHLSRQRAFHPCKCKQSSSGSRQLVSALAVVDQEPLQPARETRPTAQQIFDLQHVPHLSPSLVLYFPLGEKAQQFGHSVKDTSPGNTSIQSNACRGYAGQHTNGLVGATSSCRCSLADGQQHINCWYALHSCLPPCLSECLSVPVQGVVHHNTSSCRTTIPSVTVLSYTCPLQYCKESWESRSTGTILTGFQISDMCLSATT